jgi:hypothetical protein
MGMNKQTLSPPITTGIATNSLAPQQDISETFVGFRLDEPAEEMSWGSTLAGTHSAMLGPRRVFR